ncbi:hypothetical protein IWQ60_006937 [Tieghemiomyces parasiticus]|uniref:ATPase n=1 Tax=Tieghemiomyces parasiticus TaxID=78921 RepID=A0A9W8AA94_9FUNG|nr:hypothetical protein IWQ60_006937 [Tieghemiomyces parasiticus]
MLPGGGVKRGGHNQESPWKKFIRNPQGGRAAVDKQADKAAGPVAGNGTTGPATVAAVDKQANKAAGPVAGNGTTGPATVAAVDKQANKAAVPVAGNGTTGPAAVAAVDKQADKAAGPVAGNGTTGPATVAAVDKQANKAAGPVAGNGTTGPAAVAAVDKQADKAAVPVAGNGTTGPAAVAAVDKQADRAAGPVAGNGTTGPATVNARGLASLAPLLRGIQNQQYGAYKRLSGAFTSPAYELHFDHIQNDLFAPPSRLRVRVPQSVAGFPVEMLANKTRTTALADFVLRAVYRYILTKSPRRFSRNRGRSEGPHSPRRGLLAVDVGGQRVLPRSALLMDTENVELRFYYRLPAQADPAISALTELLPKLIKQTLHYTSYDAAAVAAFVDCVEDQATLRMLLREHGLVAFVPNGAILPRESGASDRPLATADAVPFQSPPSLEVSLSLPHRGKVTGMGIRRGVTLIVGGGFHGKSTLLQALEMGVYNHIPGDGREFISADVGLLKVRAEDGRAVTRVDITPFINNLPRGKSTQNFTTADASGSTSMAATIQEGLEMGCTGFLFDEDTCATNFLIRDYRMQHLVPKVREPITPLIAKVRALHAEHGVSSIMVIGGCGDYLDVADTVIGLDQYVPADLKIQVADVVSRFPLPSPPEADGESYGTLPTRRPVFPAFTDGKPLVRVSALHQVTLLVPLASSSGVTSDVTAAGMETVATARAPPSEPIWDLSGLDQLAEVAQTRCIAGILETIMVHQQQNKQQASAKSPTMREMLDEWKARFGQASHAAVVHPSTKVGPASLPSPYAARLPGNWSEPRLLELGSAINRLRGFTFTTEPVE